MNEYIPITKPSITDLEISNVNDAIRYGWGAKCYQYIEEFQSSFSEYIGTEYALATSSCTGATHLALAAIGIKSGDEVIIPETTWLATASPVTYLGARPVFVDVLPDTWCIDPKKIEAAITINTKAIIAVHVYGNLSEMDEIRSIAAKYNLHLIEDAAEALGSQYKDKKAGSIGDIGVFSFHGTKSMTTGEGGMLVTDNEELFNKIKSLADHGRIPEERKVFYPHFIGYKYKMSNLQAALGCAQLSRINELIDKKRTVFNWYKDELFSLNAKFNFEQQYAKNSFWMPTILVDSISETERDLLISDLKKEGIDTRPFFYPLSLLPMFEDKRDNEIAYSLYGRGINLPSFFEITRDQVKYISQRFLTELAKVKNV